MKEAFKTALKLYLILLSVYLAAYILSPVIFPSNYVKEFMSQNGGVVKLIAIFVYNAFILSIGYWVIAGGLLLIIYAEKRH